MTRSRSGIVLVLVSGLLVLLAFLVAVFASSARLAALAGAGGAQALGGKLAAESGLEYAAARLWQEWKPVYPKVPVNAGDDWTAREASLAVPLERVASPSYSHGDRSPASWGDFDGNGRLDAASGRLRGAVPFGQRYLLRVVSHAGLICINGGELGHPNGDQDADGVLNRDDPQYAEDSGITFFNPPNGAPDWRDTDFEGNRSLINFLNNLGALVGLDLDPMTTYTKNLFGIGKLLNESFPYEVSDLGKRVVSARPRGGYGSVEDLRPILGADYEKVAPYLSTVGEIVSDGGGLDNLYNPQGFASQYGRLDFNVADRTVIEAAFRYLTASGRFERLLSKYREERAFVRLLPTEAGRIAAALADARPIWNWHDFLKILVDLPDAVFEDDPFVGLAVRDPASDPVPEGPFRRRLKEDLILAHMDFGFGWALEEYRAQRRNLGVVREGAGHGVPVEGSTPMRDIRYRREDFIGGQTFPFSDPLTPADFIGLVDRSTVPFSLAPHRGGFRIECAGWSSVSGGDRATASCMTDIELGRELRLANQLDFEQFLGWTGAWDAPPRRYPGGIRIDSTSTRAVRSGIHSWPCFPVTTFRNGAWSDNGSSSGPVTSYQGYYTAAHFSRIRGSGWMELGARQWNDASLLAARGAFPFNEDGEPDPLVNRYSSAKETDNGWDPIKYDVRQPNHFESAPVSMASYCPMGPSSLLSLPGNFTMGWRKYALFNPPYSSYVATPFPRGPFDRDPSKVQEMGGPTGEVMEGTIGLWIFVPDGEPPMPSTDEDKLLITLRYCKSQSGINIEMRNYMTLTYDHHAEEVTLWSNGPSVPVALPVPVTPYRATGWRMVAITFDRGVAASQGWGPDDTAATVWVDGEPVNFGSPFQVCFRPKSFFDQDGSPPSVDEMDVIISTTAADPPYPPVRGFDDFFVLPHSLSQQQLRDLLLNRRVSEGHYRSSLFTFEPELLPEGGRIAGYAWDAFVPGGGSCRLGVTPCDDSGVPSAPVSEVLYDGSGPQVLFVRPGDLAWGFDWEVALKGSPSSPILDEFRIFYTPGNVPRRGAITTR